MSIPTGAFKAKHCLEVRLGYVLVPVFSNSLFHVIIY